MFAKQIMERNQHNVIPDKCTMLVDIRTNEFYDNEEVYEFICQHLKSEVKAHSFRFLSHISNKILEIGSKCYTCLRKIPRIYIFLYC